MRTFVEKILNAPSGNIVMRRPDVIMSHDNSAHICKLFGKMGGKELQDPSKILVVLDRKTTGTTDELVRDYNAIYRFMEEQKVEHFFDCDKGICHQILAEQLKQGMLIVGNDSHTCTAGAFNCLAVGLNKTETALLWKTGRMWFRVPETIKVTLKNSLPEGVYAKDLALWIVGMLKEEDVAYKSLEYHGDGVHSLTISDRMTIANVVAEVGLKSAVFPPDDVLADYFGDYAVQGVWADENAVYSKEIEIDLSKVCPLVMEVGETNEIKAIPEWGPLEIQQGLIGGCASGRLEDLRTVARIVEGKQVTPGFRLSIVPASRAIYLQAIEEGIIDVLVKAGASILGSSCGPCLGSSHMIGADTRRFITTVNSNSMRRLASIGVKKYVASPATVARTALTGLLTAEKTVEGEVYPYWEMPGVWVTIGEFDHRRVAGVWNYADVNNVACEQLLAEKWTCTIPEENAKVLQEHLLEGLDSSFAKEILPGDILLGGENFGNGKLVRHAVIALRDAGVKAILVKSADRRFFRMAANNGLWVIIVPQVVENYRSGDLLVVDIEDGRIFLNKEEYRLSTIDSEFIGMVRKGGIY